MSLDVSLRNARWVANSTALACAKWSRKTTNLEAAHAIADEDCATDLLKAGRMRRAALLETMYASGMTVSETLSLQWTAFREDGCGLDVVCRGGKSRWVTSL
jgi:site-specific recombinase XerD